MIKAPGKQGTIQYRSQHMLCAGKAYSLLNHTQNLCEKVGTQIITKPHRKTATKNNTFVKGKRSVNFLYGHLINYYFLLSNILLSSRVYQERSHCLIL